MTSFYGQFVLVFNVLFLALINDESCWTGGGSSSIHKPIEPDPISPNKDISCMNSDPDQGFRKHGVFFLQGVGS